MRVLLCLLVAACGPSTSADVDARLGSGSGGSATGSDLPVNCQPYAYTDQDSTGAKSVATYNYALVDAGIDDDVVVTGCVKTTIPTYCQTGHTCTGATQPAGQQCFRNRGGTYVGGKLLVLCGYSSASYDAGGTQISSVVGLEYENLKVHKN